MKTQIKDLRSGTRYQLLNDKVDYSNLPPATSHSGHSGSNYNEVARVWAKVVAQNPEKIKIKIKGLKLELKANWSLSKKSVSYSSSITREDLKSKFGVIESKTKEPYITIFGANDIEINNGKKLYRNVCPSLVEIV